MQGLTKIGEEQGVPLQMVGLPPVPMLKFTEQDEARREALKTSFFGEAASRGVLFHPGHCWFLSVAHTDEDLARTLDVARESLARAKDAAASRAR